MRSKFTVIFSEKQAERLTELAEAMDMNKAQVVREALRILGKILRETEQGDSVALLSKDAIATKELKNLEGTGGLKHLVERF